MVEDAVGHVTSACIGEILHLFGIAPLLEAKKLLREQGQAAWRSSKKPISRKGATTQRERTGQYIQVLSQEQNHETYISRYNSVPLMD